MKSLEHYPGVSTNGVGEPRYYAQHIPPGSIIRWGVDDDMTMIVIANYAVNTNVSQSDNVKVLIPKRRFVMLGCFCDSHTAYERDRIMTQDFDVVEKITLILPLPWWLP